ncbi:MAG TPA: tetratricopeptide repeat protein [Patescibacteria group bacterium]|jgi:tetratricopeptide (TPR) repeat protein|nr:tetratricopeptide repeat protein [Patescibacteria group bacterium]
MKKSTGGRPKSSTPKKKSAPGDLKGRGRKVAALCVLVIVAGIGAAIWTQVKQRPTSDHYIPAPRGTLTFNKDIAPILFDHCAMCHRPGQSAPFALLTYPEVSKHAKEIADVTGRRYMPPWLPEPGYGDFVGARLLSTAQIGMIRQWVAEGGIEGKLSDLPPLPTWNENWQLGEPDLVVTMPEPYTLPANGKDVYRNFVIPIPLAARRYVKAVEFRPGTPKIVHHAFIRFDRTRESRQWDARDPEVGFSGLHTPSTAEAPAGHFLSWQPGKRISEVPNGLSWMLETNTDLVLQLHLQPTGKPERIQSSVGFYFTDQPPTNTPAKIWLLSYDIDIPANDANYVLKDSYVLPADVQVLGLLPHTHYLGKELQSYAILPGGARQWLLRIKQWDFNWQGDYRYVKPVFLPKGTTIKIEFTYDNSTNNIHNPNQPPQRVRYGLQSTDEMGELWLQILARNTNDLALISRDYNERLFRDGIAYNEYLLRINPRDAAAETELGRLNLFLRQYADARKHFLAALQIKPDADEPHYYLGLLSRQQNKLVEARSEFENALRLNPNNYKAQGNLGVVLAEQGDLESAEAHFRTALRINPDDALAQECLDELLKAKRQLPGKK